MCGVSWGNWYTSLDFQKREKDVSKGGLTGFHDAGGAAVSYTAPRNYRSRLPGVRLRDVTRNSLTFHLARLSNRWEAWTLLNADCSAALGAALSAAPGTQDLPTGAGLRHPPTAPGSPLPVLGSPSAIPVPTTLSRPTTDNLLYSRCSQWPRSDAAACGDHTDTITTLGSQNPLRQGPKLKTRKQTPSSYPHFRVGGSDQSSEAKVEVRVTTARGGAETAEGAGV